jgi:hypothetical protein
LRLAYLLLIVAAFALRIHQLDTVPLRGDEAYSAVHWTASPFSDDWRLLWQQEPAPVGAFTLYWAWDGLAGNSAFAFRYLSVLGSVTALAALVAMALRLLHDRRLALLVGVLWTVHPFVLWHAQDARIYSVLSATSILSFYWFLRAADAIRAGQSPRWWPYILLQTVAVYLYYLEPLWIAAHMVYALSDRRVLRRALRAWVWIAVLCIPVVVQLFALMVVGSYEGNAESADLARIFSWFVPTLLFGTNTWPALAGMIVAALIVAAIMTLNRGRHFLLAWVLVPLVGLIVASIVSSFFRPRYVQTIIPGMMVALVAWAVLIPNRRWRVLAPAMLVLGYSIISTAEIRDYFVNDPPKAPDWPGLMTYLDDRSTNTTTVIFSAPDPAIEYYFTGAGEAFILPLEWYTLDWQAQLDALLAQEDTLFLLTGPTTGDTGAYLQANAQRIPGDTWPNVVQYRPWQVNAREIAHSLNLRFGDVAVLRGYTVLQDTTLILYWEALAPTPTDYSVLLHLETAPGAPVIALDHAIAETLVSTRTWEPGTFYRDPVALPPDLPAGALAIRVGMYPAGNPEAAIAIDDQTRLVIGEIILDALKK